MVEIIRAGRVIENCDGVVRVGINGAFIFQFGLWWFREALGRLHRTRRKRTAEGAKIMQRV
jgi:hypothetical protein